MSVVVAASPNPASVPQSSLTRATPPTVPEAFRAPKSAAPRRRMERPDPR